ncbi:rhodanese-like domain-containing protein [Halobellus captivus]|uniref:rhodanese-like domain-containing protein n=1 Tax=Halobellus captivus TaxID=2592614 RepID=UPI0011A9F156|nr:rhodanese-like domain-containing protein [Halobellus captivus]
MIDRPLSRRRAIKSIGAAALVGVAGCSSDSDQTDTESSTSTETPTATRTETATSTQSDSLGLDGPRHGDDLPADPDPTNGYPPEFEVVPEERSIDTAEFETLTRGDFEVKLVPTDVAYYWYARGEARFADTRSESEFEVSHIFGAVLSPAGDGIDLPDDPVLEWPTDDRIVTYCDCPHHLSSLRAASLMNRGYERVYALDEGFGAWREHNFPLAGTDAGRTPPTRTITGTVPTQYEGETAWAFHTESNQREATEITSDGSYTLEFRFVDVTAESTIRVETPAYEVTAPLGDLTNGTVTSDGTVSASGGTTNTTNTANTSTR